MLADSRLDQYERATLLAQSAMASVYRAIDAETGACVVLKVPLLELEGDIVFYDRFCREEAIGLRLDHPNLVRFLKPKEKSRMYLVMEYIEGRTLRAMLRERGHLSSEEALAIARQVAEALVYVHAQGVVHRDLKPENVLVEPDGHVKLIDFGIALSRESRRLTWSGLSTTLGTPDYMAPEQIKGRRGNAQTDVYALGTMLFEMTTGHLPYEGGSVYRLLRAKVREPPKRPSFYRADIDPHIEEIILRAIEPRPSARYPAAEAMLGDLRNPTRAVPTAHRLVPLEAGIRRLAQHGAVVLAVLLFLMGVALLALVSQPPRRGRLPAPRDMVAAVGTAV